MEKIRNFFNDESGASAVEYGLLVSLIACVIVIAVKTLGQTLNTKFGDANTTDPIGAPSAARLSYIALSRHGWGPEAFGRAPIVNNQGSSANEGDGRNHQVLAV